MICGWTSRRNQKNTIIYKGDVLCLDKNPFDPHSQYIILCCNTPIICKINDQNLNIVNNETFIIHKIKDEIVLISNEEKELEIDIKDFHRIFMLHIVLLFIVHKAKCLKNHAAFTTGRN